MVLLLKGLFLTGVQCGGQIMLILTRRMGESLRINDDISITVLGIKGNQVRLGIDAPREVEVHREEIYLRIQAEKQANKAGNDAATDADDADHLHDGAEK